MRGWEEARTISQAKANPAPRNRPMIRSQGLVDSLLSSHQPAAPASATVTANCRPSPA